MQALFGWEIKPPHTKPFPWQFFHLHIVLWIILTHINYGILFFILAKVSLHLLQILWMSCWIQSPTFVSEMTLLMAMSPKKLHILCNMVFIIQWTYGFLSLFLWKFPICGNFIPTSWNIMVIQTTIGTCKFSPILMWIFTMFIIIKRNLI